ncbi:MAG: hypothetical protein SynsKO_39130 [Synoicihabitans sp.]
MWSNVLAALLLSAPGALAWPPLGLIALTFLAGSLAYAGGATLNDVFDAGFDRRHRPDRAIPSGSISLRTAAWVGCLQLGAGMALLIWAGASVLMVSGLGGVIVLYNWLHKRWVGSVVLMAGCRVMLGLAVASLPTREFSPALLVWVAILFTYIVVLSLLARREYHPGAPAEKLARIVRKMLAFIPMVDAVVLLIVVSWKAAVICALAVPLGKVAQRLAASG